MNTTYGQASDILGSRIQNAENSDDNLRDPIPEYNHDFDGSYKPAPDKLTRIRTYIDDLQLSIR